MGVIGKLAFWRKSSKKAGAIEPFAIPAALEIQSPKADLREAAKEPLQPQLVASPARGNISALGNPRDDEACPPSVRSNTSPQPPAASSSRSPAAGSSSQQPPVAQAASSSPPRSSCRAKGSMVSSDADDLEAELCDEVLFPLPESKLPPAVAALSRAASVNDQELVFDRTLEEVFAGVGQAFGPMIASSLQSPKWDKRAQALKAVGTMLRGLDLQGMAAPGSTGVLGKGLQLRDRVCCWRSCCQLLDHMMRDKVMPVRLASHELFQEAFGNAEDLVSQEECHFALKVLIQHPIDRLGDSNLRLHESARKCIFFCTERPFLLGLEDVLWRLKARLNSCGKGGERQKVHHGVLDAVNFLLSRFPGRRLSSRNLDDDEDEEAGEQGGSWTAADIAPFIEAGLDDSLGPRVRSTVIALAVTVYQTFGLEAMNPVLEGLRPAKQVLLRQKFQEYEDMDPEDFQRASATSATATPSDNNARTDSFGGAFNDLVVCGSSVDRPGALRNLPGSFQDPDEEDLMDGILEETGMVFNGACITNGGFGHDDRCLRPIPGLSRTLMEDDLEEEHRILEEELLQLDNIVEEEDLYNDYQRNGLLRAEMSMEVC